MSMQGLQPRVKEIQARYKGKDQQEMQMQIGQLYKDAGVNPLAGCLPTLATLPVWIGLYRSVHNSCCICRGKIGIVAYTIVRLDDGLKAASSNKNQSSYNSTY